LKIAYVNPTKTPTPTETRTPKPTKTPKPTPTPSDTPTPRPTNTPNIYGTKGFVATALRIPPLELSIGGAGGVPGDEFSLVVDPTQSKLFVWRGFPGISIQRNAEGAYAYVKNYLGKATVSAYWYIQVSQSGYYDVFIFIPDSPNATSSAQYFVFQNNVLSPGMLVDQSTQANQWINLGSYYFLQDAVDSQYVMLDNQTREDTAARVVLLGTLHLVFRP
jgi:hypothetical protein